MLYFDMIVKHTFHFLTSSLQILNFDIQNCKWLPVADKTNKYNKVQPLNAIKFGFELYEQEHAKKWFGSQFYAFSR